MEQEKHPVGFDPKTRTWITVNGEHQSWMEALQSVKNKLTDNKN